MKVHETRDKFKTLLNIYDRFFCENIEKVLLVLLFSRRTPAHMFDRILYRPLVTTKSIRNYGEYLKVDYCTVSRYLVLLERYQTNKSVLKVCTKEKSQLANTRKNQQYGIIRFWFYYYANSLTSILPEIIRKTVVF